MNKNFERIKKEYEDFRKEVLLLSKEEIFEEVFTIHFYKTIYEYLEFKEDKKSDKMSLAELFEFYKKSEYLHYNTYDDIDILIDEYKELSRVK